MEKESAATSQHPRATFKLAAAADALIVRILKEKLNFSTSEEANGIQ